VCPFHNNQRDGIHQHTIHKGQAAYQPNSIDKIGQQKHRLLHQMVVLKVILKKLVDINFVKEVRLSLIISLNRDFITKPCTA
jgi:catalase